MDAMQICADLWLGLALVWAVGMLRTKATQERAEIVPRLVYGAVVVTAYWLMFGGASVPAGWLRTRLYARMAWIDFTGIALTALGVAFAIWARFYLGRNWSGSVTVKVGHELICGGPYRWVRHPIYTGLLLAMLGTGLVRGQVRAILGFSLLLAGFWVKLDIEERFMRKTFGGQYQEYARTTGALVPRLRN
jgi:protein-S-isoprenylcysteine O-methyltransferase Ste14